MEHAKPDQLARLAPFAALRTDALRRLSARIVAEPARARAVVWRPGQAAEGLVAVRSGVLRESLEAPEQERELCLGLIGRGELAGEGGVLAALSGGDATRHTLLQVQEEAVLWRIPLEALAELARAEPAMSLALGALDAVRRRRVEEQLSAQVFQPVETRLAAALVRLGRQFGVRDSRGVIVNVRLAHRDLAALAGASRETASVALAAWRRAGWIAVEARRVVILEPERLAELGQAGELVVAPPVEAPARSRRGRR